MIILGCAAIAFSERSVRYVVSAIKRISDFHEILYGCFHQTLSRQCEFHEKRRNNSRALYRDVIQFLPERPTFSSLKQVKFLNA
jgi:hypothetical protein